MRFARTCVVADLACCYHSFRGRGVPLFVLGGGGGVSPFLADVFFVNRCEQSRVH